MKESLRETLLASLKNRRLSKPSAIGLALFVTASFFLAVLALARTASWHIISHQAEPEPAEPVPEFGPENKVLPRLPLCNGSIKTASPEIWKQAKNKYKKLRDDKFTIALQTYRRPEELNSTLHILLDDEIPSLHEIVVVWNNLEEAPPANFTSQHGVPVRYRASPVNSLNQKLIPDPAFETQAVLLSDDDVYYFPDDLEFVFQTWRTFGKQRLTGAMPRCIEVAENSEWKYAFCDSKVDEYDLIITNLAFSHISFLDYYSSADPIVSSIRAYVDDHLNCEDIAMNYVFALLTGTGPLFVKGNRAWHNSEPQEGISRKPGHMEARSKCLNDFAEMYGCMPLIGEATRIERGHW